jgi:tetratricopeptide (TPR) repeat protein
VIDFSSLIRVGKVHRRAREPVNLAVVRSLYFAFRFVPLLWLPKMERAIPSRFHLQVHPKNERAHLIMAQLATEPTNLQPGIALKHLGTLETKTPEQAAKIKFLKGKTHYQLGRYDLAEDCWTEALRLNPVVP